MSIIYDALKKVQKTNPTAPKPETPQAQPIIKNKQKIPLKAIITNLFQYAIVAGLGFFAVKLFFSYLGESANSVKKNEKKQTTAAKTTAARKKATTSKSSALSSSANTKTVEPPERPKPSPLIAQKPSEDENALVLNGIFFSGDSGYVLINNQIAKVGDTVAGVVVKSITTTEVEVERNGVIEKLTTRTR